MRHTSFAATAFMLLCGTAAAATLPSRQAGMWQSTTTVTGADGKTLPGGSDVVSVSCIDAATDTQFFVTKANECSSVAISGGGSTYTIDSSCTHAGKPLTIHETLAYQDAQTVVLNATYTGPAGPILVNSALKYQGACLAGMAPGDEGSVDGGAFTKSDNINDSDNQ